MSVETRIRAEDARRLKSDTAFTQFVDYVRDKQIQNFILSNPSDVEQREDAHAIIRALSQIEVELQAAEDAELIEGE